MLKEIGAALQWYAMLGARFFRVFPVGTVSAITLTFLAQLALIASLLLPLKIVMIMSSGNIPNIFPTAIDQLNEQAIVAAITALAVGAFIFNSVATKTIDNLAIKGARRIQEHSRKLALFENQETLAQNAILKFSVMLASSFFALIGLAILTILYLELAAIAIGFILICVTVYSTIFSKAPSLWKTITDRFTKQLNTISNIGFLTLFLSIVIDYLVASIPSFLIVLLSIILSRQIFSQMASAVSGAYFLKIHQPKLKAIAFEGHTLPSHSSEKSGAVWSVLTDPKTKKDLINRIQEVAEFDPETSTLAWLDTGLQNILHFVAELGPDSHQKYLVKIFDKNKSAKARHEATLLFEPPIGLPSPKLLTATTILQVFHVHIFDITGYNDYVPTEHHGAMEKYEIELLGATPPNELVRQYQRSRMMIWDRINDKLVQRICSITQNTEQSTIDEFIKCLPKLKSALKEIPLTIQNPSRNSKLFLVNQEGEIVSIHWGEWSLDPAGSNLIAKHNPNTIHSIKECVKICQLKKNITEEQIELGIQTGLLDHSLNKQQYNMALDAIYKIMLCLKSTQKKNNQKDYPFI